MASATQYCRATCLKCLGLKRHVICISTLSKSTLANCFHSPQPNSFENESKKKALLLEFPQDLGVRVQENLLTVLTFIWRPGAGSGVAAWSLVWVLRAQLCLCFQYFLSDLPFCCCSWACQYSVLMGCDGVSREVNNQCLKKTMGVQGPITADMARNGNTMAFFCRKIVKKFYAVFCFLRLV